LDKDSGLLDQLLPAFTTATGWQVKTGAVGSGQAIELGRRGEADVLLVHSPAAEQKFVAEGATGRRRLVMHNNFVLVGPKSEDRSRRCTSFFWLSRVPPAYSTWTAAWWKPHRARSQRGTALVCHRSIRGHPARRITSSWRLRGQG